MKTRQKHSSHPFSIPSSSKIFNQHTAKSKLKPEPVIVLKGLVESADSTNLDSKSIEKPFENVGIMTIENVDVVV